MAPSSVHSDSSDDGLAAVPVSASQIQTLSIRHHVSVILDLDEGNYGQWRHFFDSTLAKFGIKGHVRTTTPDADRDGEWRMVDACVINWILATVSKGVFDIIRRDRHDAFTLWHAVEGIFQDNEMQRAVYLEAELRSMVQGDLSINDYCTKLKRIADQLRDIGHPVSEPSQSARSFLILEELSFQHDATVEAGQALTVSHGATNGGSSSTSSGTKDGSSGFSAARTNNNRNGGSGNAGNGNGGGNRNNRFNRRRGNGGNWNNGGAVNRSNTNNGGANNSSAPWTAGYNPGRAW
ncbi:hybrid signal transduction histidine kinase M-like [Sorghum bicolor]|uniref:hybrid signal transduction histidine kinase M-like n=1 Tax=Sorghum bicolor TaxID=4558 RepID=UPI000B4263CD|nr:hybrid signal transduction histidine kinase M-like [Sorghum bicolor]|eukprot:XP_021321822.1 hybrid signal transduction histidine kinase M-like [Sorghum bicolor]